MLWAHRSLLALIVLAGIQIAVYWAYLPDVVASHFDGAGVPHGWSSKTAFFLLYAVMIGVIYVSFVTVPAWHARRAALQVEVPRWRARVLASLRVRMAWLGVVHLLMAIAVVQMVLDANIEHRPLTSVIYWLLGGYFVFLIGWLIAWFAWVRAAQA